MLSSAICLCLKETLLPFNMLSTSLYNLKNKAISCDILQQELYFIQMKLSAYFQQIPYPSRKKDDCISARSAGLQSFNLQ